MFHSSKLMLLVLACGSTIAGAQTAPRPTVPAAPSTGSLATHKPVPVGLKYWLFITDKANDHDSIQKEMRDNPGRFPADVELQDMSMHIGIRPEEYATVLAQILDASQRLKENQAEWTMALSNFQNSAGYSAKSVPPPAVIALGKEHDAIIDGTIRSLKHELGDKSFSKLNAWVDLNFLAETSAPAPGTGPSRPTPVVTAEPAPAVET
jgi:hypothetical protein